MSSMLREGSYKVSKSEVENFQSNHKRKVKRYCHKLNNLQQMRELMLKRAKSDIKSFTPIEKEKFKKNIQISLSLLDEFNEYNKAIITIFNTEQDIGDKLFEDKKRLWSLLLYVSN